jgi:hypothetical protein
MVQTPAEHLTITNRQEKTRIREHRCCPDEGFEVLVRLANGVAKEGDWRRIAGNAPGVFHDNGGVLLDRIGELAATIMTVDAPTHLIAGLKILISGGAHGVAWNGQDEGRPLHRG